MYRSVKRVLRIQRRNETDLNKHNRINADPDQGSQTDADPDWILDRLCRHKKLDFDMKNILYVSNMS